MRDSSGCDVVIVGAGVIGASLAYHLKQAAPESRVLLVDREKRVAAGNTAKSLALFRNIFSSSTSRALAGSSIDFYLSVGKAIQCRTNGYLWLFSAEQRGRLEDALEGLDAEKDQIDLLDRDDIQRIIPLPTEQGDRFPPVELGIYGHRCGALSPTALTGLYADRFEALGGEIRLGTDITEISLKGRETLHAPWGEESGIDYLSVPDGGTIKADQYIFATGAWTQEVLGRTGIYAGVLPKKRQLFGISVQNRRAVFVDTSDTKEPIVILPAGGVHFKPVMERNLLVVGMAGDLGVPFAMNDFEAEEEYFEQAVRPVLAHYLPGLAQSNVRLKWAGYYAYHWPDKNPVIESVENIVWVSGTSGSGIMKADALGRIGAAKALGRARAELYDGTTFRVSDLSLKNRKVDPELFVL